MQEFITFFTHFASIPPEQVPQVALRMLPGMLTGLGFALIALFLRDSLANFLKHVLEKGTNHNVAIWVSRTLKAIGGWFIWLTGLYMAVQIMPFMELIDRPAQKLFMLFVFIELGFIASSLLREWTTDYTRNHRKTDPARVTMISSVVRVGYLLIWALVFILLLNNYGVNVTAMVAGLGVGGLAVAFAFQNILKDIFGSFSIVFDKPFVIGDFIAADDFMGSVEEIGTKTTRLRSATGELIVISNNDLLSARIRNYGNMQERRVIFPIRVQYGTPAAKLEKIPTIIREILEKNEDIRFERSHFQTFTDYGLQFETMYFVLTPNYNRMMDIQQEVNLTLYKRFEKEGIRFAVPVQNMMSTLEDAEERLAEEQRPTKKPARRK